MLADGLTKGGVDRTLLHGAINDFKFKLAQLALTHSTATAGSVSMHPIEGGA